ncbi:MAG: ATP-binding protein, partial [Thermoguttaceae bacterium]
VCEAIVMILLHALGMRGIWGIVLDPILLAGLSTPLLYNLIVKPLRDAIRMRNRAEQEIAQSHGTLETILQALPVGVALVGKDKRIRQVNSAALRLTGYDSEEQVVGQLCHKTLCPAEEGKCPILDMHERIDNSERTLLHKDGKSIPILKTVVPITLDNEEVLLEAFVDISQRKQAERALEVAEQAAREQALALEQFNQALEEANWAAKAASQAKSDFLANMSHEIRTPMTAILGFVDVLLENLKAEQDIGAAETIKRNGKYLLQLINDILDLSKIEAGKLSVERVACSPVDVVADVASLMRVRAEAAGLPIEVQYVGSIPESIHCDPTRLRQILINLLGNAIKFTETGSVRLVTRLVRSDERPPLLQFDIIDTGIGMTQDQTAKLFRPFSQVDASMVSKVGGTGLGLAISRRLARMLDGDVTVTSKPAVGSTFTVTIATGPLEAVQLIENPTEVIRDRKPREKKTPDPTISLPCRVLLAEDGPDNQRLIKHLLNKAGVSVVIAQNGQLALDCATSASRDGAPFNVILMDMQMPVMSGYEATQRLRQDGYEGPIIALTANAMAGDQERCLEAGCDEYATKPIDRSHLLGLIAKYMQSRDSTASDQNATAGR